MDKATIVVSPYQFMRLQDLLQQSAICELAGFQERADTIIVEMAEELGLQLGVDYHVKVDWQSQAKGPING
jgi:hypothetical protein